MKTTFRVRHARGNIAYVTHGDHERYCVIWDWRDDLGRTEFTLWDERGRKVATEFDTALTPAIREALTAATVADIERRQAAA